MPDGFHRKEVLDFQALRQMGVMILPRYYGVDLFYKGKTIVVTAWPFDVSGKTANKVTSSPAITG